MHFRPARNTGISVKTSGTPFLPKCGLCRSKLPARMKRKISWLLGTLLLDAFAQIAIPLGQGVAQEQQPAEVVRKLYREVVTRHPLGVPYGSDQAAIWPLLSKRLVRVFETRNACDRDWKRQHPNANVPPFILKPPGFYEDGLFSGPDELGYINGAAVGAARVQADGSYLVYVSVWSYYDMGEPSLRTSKIYRWRVAARVISENGQFAVDDILGFKGVFSHDKAVYMSKMLSIGCNGSHAIPD